MAETPAKMRYSFQAPGLYETCGFERVAELPDWPPGHVHVFLRRRLKPAPGRWARTVVVFALAFALTSQTGSAQNAASAAVTVRMSSFSFDPEHLRLRVGTPVVLHFVNESGGGHDYSAPAFFAASAYPPGASAPAAGRVELRGGQTRDVALTPKVAGTYKVECTHFLHELFGMTGTVEVVP